MKDYLALRIAKRSDRNHSSSEESRRGYLFTSSAGWREPLGDLVIFRQKISRGENRKAHELGLTHYCVLQYQSLSKRIMLDWSKTEYY